MLHRGGQLSPKLNRFITRRPSQGVWHLHLSFHLVVKASDTDSGRHRNPMFTKAALASVASKAMRTADLHRMVVVAREVVIGHHEFGEVCVLDLQCSEFRFRNPKAVATLSST